MLRGFGLFLVLIYLQACVTTSPPPESTPSPNVQSNDVSELAEPRSPDLATHPLLSAYLQRVQEALNSQPPILKLGGLDLQQEMAQTIALSDPQLLPLLYDQRQGAPLRTEVFGVVPWRNSDRTPSTTVCQQARCYRVEIFNFATNSTLISVVNLDQQRVLSLDMRQGAQPDIPPHLADIAREIATKAPEVHTALGYAPNTEAALMANTKTALNKSRCERSEHLCVAPTFVEGDRALWAIVDLTTPMLVGLRWTNVGTTGPAITEKSLQNEAVLYFCENTTHVERDGWSFDYILTSSDGLRISDVSFQGRPFIESAKLVDWHVNYSETDGFGYSDAVGCPYFSQAAVIAIRPPEIIELRDGDTLVGFSLHQEFWSELWPQPCNYYYGQTFDFYLDGRFRPKVASMGRGCGDDGTYRPVSRIALAGNASFEAWNGESWQAWSTEGWQLSSNQAVSPEGTEYRVRFENGDVFQIATGRGQFGDGGRGDNAYIYVTRLHADRDEGQSDMLTIGPCCNTNEEQGPEKFIDDPPESIENAQLVFWYVPQLKNDGRPNQQYCWAESILQDGIYVPQEYPCWSGPLFQPETQAQP
jgi:hypothetical protein